MLGTAVPSSLVRFAMVTGVQAANGGAAVLGMHLQLHEADQVT